MTGAVAVSSTKPARWRSVTGLDFHVLLTLLFRGWSVLAGAVTVLLLPLWLSPQEQGYYYTFLSVLGLQVLFELGLAQVIVQLVSHEMAHLKLDPAKAPEGDASRIERLASLARLFKRWYRVAALLFAVVGGTAGAAFFMNEGSLPLRDWAAIWTVLVLCTAANLTYMPALAFAEASGQVGEVSRLRLIQSVIGYAFLWGLLYLGGGLWAATIVPLVGVIGTGYWIWSRGKLLSKLAKRPVEPGHQPVDWRRDVLPFQWRIALSWISGYFIFHLLTPLIFARQGSVEAGRLGLALTIFTAISTVGMSWMVAKTPSLAMHVSRGERAELNALFNAVLWRSLAFTAMACLGVMAGAHVLLGLGIPVLLRVAEPGVLWALALVCLANCFIFSAATYMRAHKEEAMLPVSITTGLSVAVLAYFGSMHSMWLMVVLYAGVTLLLTLPWTFYLFQRYYRRTA